MSHGRLRASLVIPCYNEAENLQPLIARCRERLSDADVEVILVDNGSSDGTADVLAEAVSGDRFIRSIRVEHNQGYGFGILCGLQAAQSDLLAWTHADMQTDPGDLLEALHHFEAAASPERLFVKGKRAGRPVADAIFTMGMAVFESCLLQQALWDINAQPTAFHRQFFDQWAEPPHDFSLDLYAYHRAKLLGLRVERFPVHFGARAHGISRWNVDWKSKLRFIRRTVAFSLELRQRLNRA